MSSIQKKLMHEFRTPRGPDYFFFVLRRGNIPVNPKWRLYLRENISSMIKFDLEARGAVSESGIF